MHELQQYDAHENHIAYRDDTRYVLRFNNHFTDDELKQITPWKGCKSALITGGLGALGIEVAHWLAKNNTQYLLLTGVSELPERSTWPQVTDLAMKEKVAAIQLLEGLKVTVKYVAVNVVNKSQMRAVIEETEREWDIAIQGVFHLAGVTTDNVPIANMDKALLEKVLSVKMQGALTLHELFSKSDLVCFVLFSSIAAVPYFGMSGLSAYAMANEFLNGLALHRRSQGLAALSINWVAWAEKGMSFRYNHDNFLNAVGMSSLTLAQGIEILSYLLPLNPPTSVICKINWQKFLQMNADARKVGFFTHLADQFKTEEKVKFAAAYSQEEVTTSLLTLFTQLLGLELAEVNLDEPFQNYGMDSIIGINFIAEISEIYPGIVSPMDLYRYTSLNQLAHYILQHYQSTQPEAELVRVKPSFSEQEYLSQIKHLSDEEITNLIEDELKEFDQHYA